MIEKIKNYLLNNNYNGDGLTEYLVNTSNDRRYKAHWQAATFPTRSGIIKYMGIRYYFSCISPWAGCPDGRVIVEKCRRL